jgi:hypothetical protein
MSFKDLPKGLVGVVVVVLLLIGRGTATAQTVNVSGSQTTGLTVSSAIAGSEPIAVSSVDGSTTYTCSIPKGPAGAQIYRITAVLTADMPAGTTLKVKLAAPLIGGVSAGWVTLSTTPTNVVTGLPENKNCAATNIQYQFTATAAAGVIGSPGNTRNVTFTIVTP